MPLVHLRLFISQKRRTCHIPKFSEDLLLPGLTVLPGAGAEILSDRVRQIVSPAKATAGEWLDVMREAHRLNLPTSATMMYGHIETVTERIGHLVSIREIAGGKAGRTVMDL